MKIKKGGQEYYLAIGGGFIEVTKNKVMVLVTRAVHAKELSEADILRAKREAETALKRRPTGTELATAQTTLRQSFVDLRLLRRRKTPVH